jgi:hypothetical protein
LHSSAVVALLALLDATVARAPAEAPPPPAAEPPPRRLLPIAAALAPGLIIHGSGHFVAGDRRSAYRLLAAESVGLGVVAAGIAGLSLTGASRKTVAPFILLTGAGVATMATTALADLYGVSAPAGGWGRPLAPPPVEASLATLYVNNPTFPYRWVAGTRAALWTGGWRWAPAVYSNADAQTLRFELRAGYRLRGPRPGDEHPSSTHVDLSAGLLHHRERRDPAPFDHSTGDLSIDGRFGLGGLLPSLMGSFVEWGAGAALGAYHYGGPVDATEAMDALLMRFGFGCHFGQHAARSGELLLAYDHRHDGFAGGMKVGGLGSGAGGHMEITARTWLGPRWGLAAELQLGSAHVYGLSLRLRP